MADGGAGVSAGRLGLVHAPLFSTEPPPPGKYTALLTGPVEGSQAPWQTKRVQSKAGSPCLRASAGGRPGGA